MLEFVPDQWKNSEDRRFRGQQTVKQQQTAVAFSSWHASVHGTGVDSVKGIRSEGWYLAGRLFDLPLGLSGNSVCRGDAERTFKRYHQQKAKADTPRVQRATQKFHRKFSTETATAKTNCKRCAKDLPKVRNWRLLDMLQADSCTQGQHLRPRIRTQ